MRKCSTFCDRCGNECNDGHGRELVFQIKLLLGKANEHVRDLCVFCNIDHDAFMKNKPVLDRTPRP